MIGEKIQTNAFKLDNDKIPKEVFIYDIMKVFENSNEHYSFISGYFGVEYGNNRMITLVEPDDTSELKLIEKRPLREFGLNYQEELLSRWIRKLLRENALYKRLTDAIIKSLKRRGKRLGKVSDRIEITVYPNDIKHKVLHYKGDFYLFVDFSFSVSTVVDLWSYVDKDLGRLKELVNSSVRRWIKFEFKPEGKKHRMDRAEIVEDKSELERTLNYIKKEYKKEYENWIKKGNVFDKSQPILKVDVGYNVYPFIPQFCKLVFNMEDISEEERRFLKGIWTFKNEERMKVITEAMKEVFGDKREFLDIDLKRLDPPDLLLKGRNGFLKIKDTFKIFSWMWGGNQNPIYLPYYVPEILKNKEITTYILIDEDIKNNKVEDVATEIFKKYNNKLRKYDSNLPFFNYQGRTKYFSHKDINFVLDDIPTEESLGFALIVGGEKYKSEDYYDDAKRRLFEKNIISQNVIYDNLKDFKVVNNLLIQILSKLGIRYFALNEKLPYDYTLGLDVGNDKYGHRSIAGCSVVFDDKGKLDKIIPIEAKTGGERINIRRILEKIQDGGYLDFRKKKVLILRDGRVSLSEIEELEPLSERWKTEFTVLSIIKKSVIRLGTDDYGYAGVLNDNLGLLLAHSTKSMGARPIVVRNKWVVSKGKSEMIPLTDHDMEMMWKLTKLNYSTLFGKGFNLRLPAPVHYADKFVKALGREWRVREDLLKEGFLYFI